MCVSVCVCVCVCECVCMCVQLEEVKWRLNLQLAQSGRTKMKLPNALFEFSIKDGEVHIHHAIISFLVLFLPLPSFLPPYISPYSFSPSVYIRRRTKCVWSSLMKNCIDFTKRYSDTRARTHTHTHTHTLANKIPHLIHTSCPGDNNEVP